MKTRMNVRCSTNALELNELGSTSSCQTCSGTGFGQLGQMTIEMILLTVVLVALAISATKALQDKQIVASLIGKPWQVVRGMIEDGVWQKQGASKANNPGLIKRHVTAEGDQP